MIKKNTKIIFEDTITKKSNELVGGVPLSVGELVTVRKAGKTLHYKVTGKKVDFVFEGADQIANIVYKLTQND